MLKPGAMSVEKFSNLNGPNRSSAEMFVVLSISVLSLLLGCVNTWLVVRILWGRTPREQRPQPSVQRKRNEPEPEVVNALEEWPEWTVPVNLLVPHDEDEELPGDPAFRVMVQ
jgi:hypothetical protein